MMYLWVLPSLRAWYSFKQSGLTATPDACGENRNQLMIYVCDLKDVPLQFVKVEEIGSG